MSNFIKTLNTGDGRQARIVISDKTWLESAAIDQLIKTVAMPGMRLGVGMPDLHPGKGQPIGAAFVSEGCIYPHLVGSDIGCGMSLWKIDMPKKKVRLDKLEKQLVGLDDPWDGDLSAYIEEKGLFTEDPFLKTEHAKLGTIGSGNHFTEIQQVNRIIDTDTFEQMGLDKQSVFLLVHSGSRGLGQKILYEYVGESGARAIPTYERSADAEHYLDRHNYANHWAIANRELIAHRFFHCLKTKGRLLLDVIHNQVSALPTEQIDALGLANQHESQYWMHRKGVSPTDQGLVVIPGSRGSLSYLVKPRQSNMDVMALGGFSLAHGAGRKWKRSDAKGRLEKRYGIRDLETTTLGSRVICKQKSLMYEEAPQAYKNISQVIDDLVGADMIDVVATLQPIITYKTRRKS